MAERMAEWTDEWIDNGWMNGWMDRKNDGNWRLKGFEVEGI